MAGFFKKLIGKKEEAPKTTVSEESWASHEVSVDVHEYQENEGAEDEVVAVDLKDTTEVAAELAITEDTEEIEVLATEPAPVIQATEPIPIPVPKTPSKAPELHAELAKPSDTVKTATIDIATLDTADLNDAIKEASFESTGKPVDPLDEITAQIQSELLAERTAKEKKARLSELLEITSQLKRPDFDEDIDI